MPYLFTDTLILAQIRFDFGLNSKLFWYSNFYIPILPILPIFFGTVFIFFDFSLNSQHLYLARSLLLLLQVCKVQINKIEGVKKWKEVISRRKSLKEKTIISSFMDPRRNLTQIVSVPAKLLKILRQNPESVTII